MSDNDQIKQERKEAMKRLREERKHAIQRTAAMVKARKKDLQTLRKQMGGGSATAPEIARATGLDVTQVIWYLATLKQYGEVVEEEKKGCYFSYKLVARETEDATA